MTSSIIKDVDGELMAETKAWRHMLLEAIALFFILQRILFFMYKIPKNIMSTTVM